jgi:hypothetical protein
MTTVVDGTSTTARPRSRTRPARVVGVSVGALLVAAGLTAWLTIGLRPEISTGPVFNVDPAALDDTSPTGDLQTSYVVDPTDGAWDGFWSFRNEGPVAVTVRLHPVGPTPEIHKFTLVELRPADFVASDLEHTAEKLTVEPGREFGVIVRFGMGCASWSDASLGLDRLTFDVTTLGLTRTVEVEGNVPILVMTEHGYVPGPDCEETP